MELSLVYHTIYIYIYIGFYIYMCVYIYNVHYIIMDTIVSNTIIISLFELTLLNKHKQ